MPVPEFGIGRVNPISYEVCLPTPSPPHSLSLRAPERLSGLGALGGLVVVGALGGLSRQGREHRSPGSSKQNTFLGTLNPRGAAAIFE